MEKKQKSRLGMCLVAMGLVFGDIGTSPMYVMKSILEGNGGIRLANEEFILGALSLVIWTVTLLTTIKYVLIVMRADNHGEGGIFALYALVKDHGKWLILPAMLGGATLLSGGILTPAVTVTTAIEGLRTIPLTNRLLGEGEAQVVFITIGIILVLFLVQQAGVSRVGRTFGPMMLLWFTFLGVTGFFHVFNMPSILRAFNPIYGIRVLTSPYNKAGIAILGSVFLATTGAEALYSDMEHVGKTGIYLSWPFVKCCLLLNYLGQGAWILANRGNNTLWGLPDLNPFFQMLPPALRPFAVLLSTAAAIIASKALITGSFTLVSEAIRLDLMPHLEIQYPFDTKGQLYIGAVNKILLAACILVVLYFRSSSRMEAAHGLAITVTMLMTTLLLVVYLWRIRKKAVLAWLVLLVFGAIEIFFFVSSLGKFAHGGYVAFILSVLLLGIMLIWYRATQLEQKYKVRLRITDYIKRLDELHNDTTIPLLANNLVFVDGSQDMETVEREVLYSIFDKDPKRATTYWFISVHVLDDPSAMYYEVETFGTDFVFRVKINLGFKVDQRINVYFRNIVQDLLDSGELPLQNRKYSIYGTTQMGNFKFAFLRKSVPSKTELSALDEFVLRAKYAIREVAGSRIRWYGLDTSSLLEERVPLFVGTGVRSNRRIERKYR